MRKCKLRLMGSLLSLAFGISMISESVAVDAATFTSRLIMEDVTITESNVKYTTLADEELPSALRSSIKNLQAYTYTDTYSEGDDLYLIVNYGERRTGGYSVSVDSVYETDDAITVTTTVNGPEPGTLVTCALTYPHVVIKISATDKDIIFNMGDVSSNSLVLETI